MSVRVSLAGRLEVETDGRTLDAARLPGRQGRVVLAYLVAERDRPVPSEELAEAVWGSAPPPTWQPALRGVVSKVRGFLEALELPADDMLTSVSGCYQLVLPDDATVDVELAAGEADAAARAFADGDLDRALEAAGAARALAGRPLLPGQEGGWVERLRAAWQQVLVRALQVVVDASLARGLGEAAVRPATELVALEPFRESAHLRLLRARAAAGDRAEALRVYDRCRRLLAEELGVDPSPELEAAYLELLRDGPDAAPRRQALLEGASAAGARGEEPFVGRGPELARLGAAWAGARAGRRRLVLVTGEAGIGKSRLAAELAALAERDGATVLLGRCDRQAGVAYLPLRAALGPYLAACPAERLRELVGPLGGELMRLWPELARRLPGLPAPTRGGPEEERYLLFEAVAGLLDAVASTGPALLAVDDLHEADEQSLALLRHLAAATRPAALLVVLTTRDEATRGDLAGVLADLLRAPGSEHLALGGLDEGEIAAVAETFTGGPPSPATAALARVVRGRTGGNPFFAGELLRHLAETGGLEAAAIARTAAGPATDDVPGTLRLVVGRRLALLGDAVRHLLEVASVIGHSADLTLLARVVDLGHDDLLDALEVAVRAEVLDERPGVPGRYAFHHGIVHDLVYRGMLASRRALLHHRVGEALEGLQGAGRDPDRLPALSDHFALGQAGDAGKATRYARRAGDQAFAQLLYEEAAHRYRQALAALDRGGGSDTDRAGLLLALGEAWVKAGQPTRATEAYLQAAAAARTAGSAGDLARAALGVGGQLGFWSLQADRGTPVALLREALAALPPRERALRALLLARLGGWLVVSAGRDAAEPHEPPSFGQALDLARRLKDQRTLALVLTDRAHALLGVTLGRPGGPGEALERTAKLARLAARLGDDGLVRAASLPRAEALLAAGEVDALDELAEVAERTAEDRRSPFHCWLSLTVRAMRAVMRGELAAGERLAEQALAYGLDKVDGVVLHAYGAQLVFLRWLQGRPDDVRVLLEELGREPAGRGWRTLHPLAATGQGREAEARRALDAAATTGFAGWRGAAEVVGLVGACALLGDAVAADRLYRLLLPYKGWHLAAGPTVYLGAGDHHLGMLAATAGRWNEAERHLFAAIAAHRRVGAHPWLALTRQAYAGMLRGRGRHDDLRGAVVFDAATRAVAATVGMDLPGWGRAALGPRD
jgi:DNA-binding SARP family transcriptional activator/tetratricopeptide (TPR) repeat protein